MSTVGGSVRSSSSPPATPRMRPNQYFDLVGLGVMHLGAFAAIFVAARPIDWVIVFSLYVLRMFAITAGYHRLFAHRAYKTSRVFQFVIALIGTLSTQKGPIWWAATHRKHHRESDKPGDVHSPIQHGFWHAHMGWVVSDKHDAYDPKVVADLRRFPELVWLDRFHVVPVLAFIAVTAFLGGVRGVTWWYCLSTVLVMHCTFFVNSLAHVWGTRRFATTDDSRNNLFIAILTLGEGWHNNHHRYMHTANQGFYWWQLDVSFYVLKVLSWLGIVWDLRKPPEKILAEGRRNNPAPFVKVTSASPQPQAVAGTTESMLPNMLDPVLLPSDAE